MVDFTRQRKVRGKPGLVDAAGVPIASEPVPRVRDLAQERRIKELLLAKAVVDFLKYCPDMDAVQCIVRGAAGVQIDAFSTAAQTAEPEGPCEPS